MLCQHKADYMQLWAGQAAGLVKSMPADQFTRQLVADVLALCTPDDSAHETPHA